MANLNAPMTDAQIQKLDYFDRAQLYHNVYKNYKFTQVPQLLRVFANEDEGLTAVKAILGNSLKYPYEIARLIKSVYPSMPRTYQEIYNRAAYLANLCDTSVEKVLRSDIFHTRNFIPDLTEEAIKSVLSVKTTGMPVVLKEGDYTPVEDEDSGSSDTPHSYNKEKKIYFRAIDEQNTLTCDTSFEELQTMRPKLPAAELYFAESEGYVNIESISCMFDEINKVFHYDFIKMYSGNIKLFTIHYPMDGDITIEEHTLQIGNGNI